MNPVTTAITAVPNSAPVAGPTIKMNVYLLTTLLMNKELAKLIGGLTVVAIALLLSGCSVYEEYYEPGYIIRGERGSFTTRVYSEKDGCVESPCGHRICGSYSIRPFDSGYNLRCK